MRRRPPISSRIASSVSRYSVKMMSGSRTRRTIRRSTCILRSSFCARLAASMRRCSTARSSSGSLERRRDRHRRFVRRIVFEAERQRRLCGPVDCSPASPAIRRSSDVASDRALENARLARTIATSCTSRLPDSRAIVQSCARYPSSRRCISTPSRRQLHRQQVRAARSRQARQFPRPAEEKNRVVLRSRHSPIAHSARYARSSPACGVAVSSMTCRARFASALTAS